MKIDLLINKKKPDLHVKKCFNLLNIINMKILNINIFKFNLILLYNKYI